MSNPVLEGVPLATAAELDSLRAEVRELQRQISELARRTAAPRTAIVLPLQKGFATLTPEEQASFAESEREARALFARGRPDAAVQPPGRRERSSRSATAAR
jgi:hypothetical protein